MDKAIETARRLSTTRIVAGIGGIRAITFLFLAAGLCVVPKFIGLTVQSLWLDELNVLRYMSFPHLDAGFFEAIRQEPHPPLWLVAMWIYGKLVGTTPFALRLSSAVTACFAVAAAYGATQQVAGRRVATITALLLGLSSVGLCEAQNVRPYSLVFLFGALSAAWFAGVMRQPDRRLMISLAAANTALCLTHYSGVFLVFGEALVIGLARWRAGTPRPWGLSLLLAATALPALVWMAWTFGVYDPMATANLHWRALDLLSPLRGFFGQFPLLILVLTPFVLERRPLHLEEDPKIVGLGAVILCVAAAVTAAALVHPSWMQNKNFYAAFPAGYLLIALIVSKTPLMRGETGAWLTLLVTATGLATYLATGYPLHPTTYYAPYREQVREAATLIGVLAHPGDTVLTGVIDINGNHTYLVPTRTYAETILRHPWRTRDIRLLAEPRQAQARVAALTRAVQTLQPHGSLIVDLPQSTKLSPAERATLESAVCITEHRLIKHTVLEADFEVSRCPKRVVVSDI
jgi:hypothetical protein